MVDIIIVVGSIIGGSLIALVYVFIGLMVFCSGHNFLEATHGRSEFRKSLGIVD